LVSGGKAAINENKEEKRKKKEKNKKCFQNWDSTKWHGKDGTLNLAIS
jgi:hypothetical protein